LKGAAESADDVAKAQANASSKGKTFLNSLIGNTKGLGQFHSNIQASGAATERLKTQIADAERELEKMSSSMSEEERAQKRRTIERLKSDHDSAKAEHDQRAKQGAAAEETGKSLKSLVATIYNSVMTTTDTLLSSTDTLGITLTALKSGIDVASKTVGFVADFAKMFTKAVPGIDMGLDLLGDGAEIAGSVLKDVVDLLGKEVSKTISAYQKMSTVGAVFAGGMEEMRATSQSANMGLEEFNRIIVDNAKDFSAAGLGMSEAAKRFASVSKTMSDSGLREQISNLGYSFEEFGGLTADIMARLGTSGQLNFKSDQEIGQLTVEYAKNLRLISNITGEDAKKKMDEARKSALKAGVYEKVMQQGGAEGLKKFQEQLALMPAQLQQGALEYIATGGTAVRDVATNMAMQQIPGIKDLLAGMLASINDPTVDSTKATDQLLKNLSAVGEQLKQSNSTIGDIGRSAILGVTGPAAEFSTLIGGLREVTSKMPTNVEEFRRQVEQMATDPGKLTKNISAMTEAVERTKGAAEAIASVALPRFSDALVTVAGTMDTVTKKLEGLLGKSSGSSEPITPQTPRQLGQLAPGTVPGVPASESSSAWNAVGTPGRSGAAPKPNSDAADLTSSPGKALGGISVGPKSGYLEKLHGVEAVVPLPDGRSIPVAMDSGGFDDLAKLMKEHIKLAQDMVDTLRGSQDIQDRMLANSY
jgi:hypothetical protein